MLDELNKYYVVKYYGKDNFSGDNCLLLAFLYETNKNKWVVFRTQELRICLTKGENFMEGYKFFYLDKEEDFENLVPYLHKILDKNPRKDYPELFPTIHKLKKIKNIDDLNIGSQYLILNGIDYEFYWHYPRPRIRPFYGILRSIDRNSLEFDTIYLFNEDENRLFTLPDTEIPGERADDYTIIPGNKRTIKVGLIGYSLDSVEIYYYPSEQRIPIFSKNTIMNTLSVLQGKKVNEKERFPILSGGPLGVIKGFLGGKITKRKSRRKPKKRKSSLILRNHI